MNIGSNKAYFGNCLSCVIYCCVKNYVPENVRSVRHEHLETDIRNLTHLGFSVHVSLISHLGVQSDKGTLNPGDIATFVDKGETLCFTLKLLENQLVIVYKTTWAQISLRLVSILGMAYFYHKQLQ